MIILGERAVVAILQQALTLFRANLSFFLSDIYGQETPDNQTELLTWWQNPENTVFIQVGYLLNPASLPQIAVTSEVQPQNRRYVGQIAAVKGATTIKATTYEGSYYCHVMAVNMNWLYWFQTWVKWALLYFSRTLETDYGLFHQRVSLGPLRPVPDSFQDSVFPFERLVTLHCEFQDTWHVLPESPITSIIVGGSDATSS